MASVPTIMKVWVLSWLKPTRPANYPLAGAEKICRIIDSFLVSATILSFVCAFVFETRISLGFIFLFLEAFFIYKTLFEIHETEKGLVFQRGKFIGAINAGWHRSLSPFWEIQVELVTTQELVIRDVVMYLKKGTEITIKKMTVFFKIMNFKKFIMIEKPRGRLYDESLAKVKGVIGKMSFIESGETRPQGRGRHTRAITNEKNFIENQIKKELNEEMSPHGVLVENVALVDIEENIVSKAEAEKVLGAAIAEKEGKIATALAEPLKDNYPAAAARIGENLSRVLTEIFADKKGRKK